ncbi:DUF202 domain-containing protein [Psychromonas ossibalaenae]|uniref:DUF202 domain-containing protein n=1 Tax=Psychromonas ossibalaenae TaxID=444922 RepID=UPI000364E6C2|nr:DUF202 domain-containing protein [Psychromonas ossibalaenae]
MPASRTARRIDDPGLQPERTSLSWFRTFFVVIIVAVVLFRAAFYNNSYALSCAAAALLFSNITVYVYACKRRLMDIKNKLSSGCSVTTKSLLSFSIVLSALVYAGIKVSRIFQLVSL